MSMTRDSDVAINAMPSREARRAVSETLVTFERERERERERSNKLGIGPRMVYLIHYEGD